MTQYERILGAHRADTDADRWTVQCTENAEPAELWLGDDDLPPRGCPGRGAYTQLVEEVLAELGVAS